ncbi:hypothetical protein KUCAC02_017008 [Chaenocephalus aceratus]|nr:hypothetical protein KUCAC02_017008 [Chaenocephalus aceratus]
MDRPQTRQSDLILNTAFQKIPTTTMSYDSEHLEVTEERLSDEIINLKVEEVRALSKKCGLDTKGSKTDLDLRLRDKMSNRVTYNTVFEKVWGASGGWADTCPCGVVYSVQCNLRAESPRDNVDLLLSWKHFPNVTVYDCSRGVAVRGNRRQPETFHPFQGRLMEPTPENTKQASEGKLHVNMPWLKHPKVPTSGNERDVLRRIEPRQLWHKLYPSENIPFIFAVPLVEYITQCMMLRGTMNGAL